MLVKWRDIPLWGVLYDSVAILRDDDRVGLGGVMSYE